MELDAIVFMVIAWGIAIGIQIFCIAMLAKHPPSSMGGGDRDEGGRLR